MKKLIAFAGLALALGGTAGYFLRHKLGRRIPLALVLETTGPARPMTEWYFADGRFLPDSTKVERTATDSLAPSREWIVVFNPGGEPAEVAVTLYFENAPPKVAPLSVPPHSSVTLAVHDAVPPGSRYGSRVRSSRPVIVQSSRGEYLPNNIVTQAMASRVGYPGPLGKRETRWTYADGLILDNETPLLEWEWISVLNPGAQAATVHLRFEHNGAITTHDLPVPAERMSTLNLATLAAFPKNQVTGVVVESSTPVVVEQVRRAYQKDQPMVSTLWSCFAIPTGDIDY